MRPSLFLHQDRPGWEYDTCLAHISKLFLPQKLSSPSRPLERLHAMESKTPPICFSKFLHLVPTNSTNLPWAIRSLRYRRSTNKIVWSVSIPMAKHWILHQTTRPHIAVIHNFPGGNLNVYTMYLLVRKFNSRLFPVLPPIRLSFSSLHRRRTDGRVLQAHQS
jgi:hypothetical protein